MICIKRTVFTVIQGIVFQVTLGLALMSNLKSAANRNFADDTGLILGLRPANERRYKVTPSLIGWAQT